MIDFDTSCIGMSGVRYFSLMNPWLDFIVIVNLHDLEKTKAVVRASMDEYWKQDDEPYGDIVERNLAKEQIPAFIMYHSTDDESDLYEEHWGTIVNYIPTGEIIVE